MGGVGFKLFDNLCENYVTIERKSVANRATAQVALVTSIFVAGVFRLRNAFYWKLLPHSNIIINQLVAISNRQNKY